MKSEDKNLNFIFYLLGKMVSDTGTSIQIMIKYNHSKINGDRGIDGIFRDLLERIRYIISNKMVSKFCFFLLIIYLLVQPIFSLLLLVFFKNNLEYSDIQYGYLGGLIYGFILENIAIHWELVGAKRNIGFYKNNIRM